MRLPFRSEFRLMLRLLDAGLFPPAMDDRGCRPRDESLGRSYSAAQTRICDSPLLFQITAFMVIGQSYEGDAQTNQGADHQHDENQEQCGNSIKLVAVGMDDVRTKGLK